MENRIKVALADKKRTNKWLSEQLECAPTTVSKWCTNSSQPPKAVDHKRLYSTSGEGWHMATNHHTISLKCLIKEKVNMDKNDKNITGQSIYLHDNYPYVWGTLVKRDAR